jgi:hypothetical protein
MPLVGEPEDSIMDEEGCEPDVELSTLILSSLSSSLI